MFFMIEEFKKKLECPADELAFYTKEPMNRHTSFRIGGPADLLVMPKTERAVCCAVKAAKQAGLPLTVLGNGSNVLVRDEGIRGVVLCIGTEYGAVHVEETTACLVWNVRAVSRALWAVRCLWTLVRTADRWRMSWCPRAIMTQRPIPSAR